MELRYKIDLQQVICRWRIFHKGNNIRPMLILIEQKEENNAPAYPHPYHLAFNDIEEEIPRIAAWMANRNFLYDAIPCYRVTFNPDHFSLFLGADLDYNPGSPDTTWIKPVNRELNDIEFQFNRNSKWWRRTEHCITRLKKQFDGTFIIMGPPIQGGLDCLAAIRGSQNLMLDLIEKPDIVKKKLTDVNTAIQEVREALWELTEGEKYGDINRHGIYSDSYTDVPQCDISCMISNEMFQEFQVPALKEELRNLTGAVYHLDGPQALQHRNSLFGMDRIEIIQWQPGYGQYEKDWKWLYKEIDAAGKGNLFQPFDNLTAEEIIDIWQNYSSKKIVIAGPQRVDDYSGLIKSLEGTSLW